MTAMATTPVPSPLAVDGVVINDPGARTLFVRLSESAGGNEKLLWRESHTALRRAEEAGWPRSHPFVWGGALGNREIVHGLPADGLMLKFHFPVGEPAYAKLISRPGLRAIVTMDRELRRFLNVRFLHVGRP